MRTIPSALATALASDGASLARLFTLYRKNSSTLYFTDCDTDITVGAITYLSAVGFSASDISLSSLSRSQTMDITAIDGSLGVTREDIMALAFEDQAVAVDLVDFTNPSGGTAALFRGKTTDISFTNDGYNVLTFEGASSQPMPFPDEVYSPRCRNELGDAKCTVDIESRGVDFTISGISNNVQFDATSVSSATITHVPGFVKFTGGNNNGLGVELRSYIRAGTAGQFFMWTRTPYPILVGDTLRAYPGCLKTSTYCNSTFGNLPNFRGEPYLPSSDVVIHPMRKTTKPGHNPSPVSPGMPTGIAR